MHYRPVPFLLLAAAGAGAFIPVRSGRREPVVAFVHVGVIPMDRERVLTDQTVMVQGDRIVALGATGQVAVPTTAVRIDGRGKFLIPGLADMHVHMWAADSVVRRDLGRYVAHGVTVVREMNSGPSVLVLRDEVARGERVGPRIYTARQHRDCWSPGAMAACVQDLQGYDFVKITSLDRSTFDVKQKLDSVAAAARQAKSRVVGHALGMERALQAPYASMEHLYGYLAAATDVPEVEQLFAITDSVQLQSHLDGAKLRAAATITRDAGVWNTPTLAVQERILAQVDSASGSHLAGGWWQATREVLRVLHSVGAGLLLGTDAPQYGLVAGSAAHRELELLVAAGLTPYEALATGTRNVAAFLGTEKQAGTVAVGKRADLVLLDANPLRDIRHTRRIAGVLANGRYFGRATLDSLGAGP